MLISFCFSVYIFHVLNYYNAEEFGYRYVQIRGIREVRSFVPGRNGRDNYSYYALLKKSLLNVTEIRLSCGKPKDFINDSCLKIKVYKGGIGIPFIEPDIDMKAVPRCNIFIDIKDVPNELIANNEDLKEKLKPQTLDKNLPLNGY